ncbi:MAG: Na+/H+ antiporter NhaA, partial [Pseudomonadota bacterium]
MATAKAKMSTDVMAGLVLGAAALLGLFFENIAVLRPYYDQLLGATLTISVEEAGLSKPLLLWINDGLMAVFFLFVALEIKKEVFQGALSDWQRAALPVSGAFGGMLIPALVFVGIVGIDSVEATGWAIPAATDIAFALGVLALFGDRVPAPLKVFLLALAIVDDLAAIVIIAAFYTSGLSLWALGLAGAALAVLVLFNQIGLRNYAAYVLVGL